MRHHAIALGFLGLVTAAPAWAEPPAQTAAAMAPATARDRARSFSDRGRRHYELGEYDLAIAAYRQAYLTMPSPGVLFNLGQAYRLKGDCRAAASAYRSFLRAGASGPARRLASTQLDAVDRCARAEAAAVVAGAGDGRALRGAAIGTAVGGALLLGAGLYFVNDAHAADRTDDDARSRRSRDVAIALGAGGGAALAAGTVLYFLGVRADRARTGARVWVAPATGSPVAGVSWAW